MRRTLIALLALAALPALAAAPSTRIYDIRIDVDDEEACLRHPWVGINISVRTDQTHLRWREHASCGYTLNRSQEQDGVQCYVRSGMCTGYGNREEISVECRLEDGYRRIETASLACPP